MDAMPRKRFSNEQIAFALRQAENGTPVEEICRKMGVSEPSFYRWKKQFSGTGCAGDPATEATRGRACEVKAPGGGSYARPGHAAGCAEAKVVRPAIRREVAGHLQETWASASGGPAE